MKYKYKIENLDCANCAKEIENHLNKDPNLKNVSCNFSKSTLTLETTLTKNIKKYVNKKSKEVEPDITILELNEEQRVLELARMSGGIEISDSTLQHAKQLRQLKFQPV